MSLWSEGSQNRARLPGRRKSNTDGRRNDPLICSDQQNSALLSLTCWNDPGPQSPTGLQPGWIRYLPSASIQLAVVRFYLHGNGPAARAGAPLGPSVLNRQQKEALRQLNLETPPSASVSADGQEVTERSSTRIGGGKSPSRSVVVNKLSQLKGVASLLAPGQSASHLPFSCVVPLTWSRFWPIPRQKSIFPGRANHWSAIIGASHSKNYVLWEYGGYASDGVKQVAELGSPVKMEEEIRQKGDEVLTVIKMKAQWPAWQPLNVRAAPSAEFSVDRSRHIMSFLTMLGPSPDWNVGLTAEDLCTKECGWVQKVVQDLIPWDAGTDSGVTYESPNKPTLPQEKIRPLTSLDHPQSPFYDPEGGAITPVARVIVERIARKGEQCNIVPDNVDDIVADIAQEEKEEDDTPETCIYSNWSPWSACSSATCEKGKRMRQRMLKAQLDLSVPCPHTQDFEPCMGPGCSDEAIDCVMSDWTEWSECNKSCGKGHTIRTRTVTLEPQFGGDPCSETIQRKKCKIRKCNRGQANSDEKRRRKEQREKRRSKQGRAEVPSQHPGCKMRQWSTWTECTKACGGGIQERLMTVKQRFKTAQLSSCKDRKEIRACNVHPC
ncbi:hypothetical protein fugu_003491 [Takifugu bimaculatus]|uniref:Spondin domain-containing protein n=1 Tax=Takifugu bimaculatus TaxID=433685 RepID=A0A4Z2BH16_9TELE|nr:hypothetical protein fugu_003491 [Takifugu bimaculatus]